MVHLKPITLVDKTLDKRCRREPQNFTRFAKLNDTTPPDALGDVGGHIRRSDSGRYQLSSLASLLALTAETRASHVAIVGKRLLEDETTGSTVANCQRSYYATYICI